MPVLEITSVPSVIYLRLCPTNSSPSHCSVAGSVLGERDDLPRSDHEPTGDRVLSGYGSSLAGRATLGPKIWWGEMHLAPEAMS